MRVEVCLACCAIGEGVCVPLSGIAAIPVYSLSVARSSCPGPCSVYATKHK